MITLCVPQEEGSEMGIFVQKVYKGMLMDSKTVGKGRGRVG